MITAGPLGPDTSLAYQMAGVAGIPSTATALVLNVTAVGATGSTFITVYSTINDRPGVSNLNVNNADAVPNQVTVALPSNDETQSVTFYNSTGSVNIIADLAGYYTPASNVGFTSLTPCRVFDTRSGPSGGTCTGTAGVAAGAVGANATITTNIAGVAGVPLTAVAVVLNVTAVNATVPHTFVTVYGDGETQPLASNLNVNSFAPVPNLVTVPIGSDGKVDLYNSVGTVDLIADIEGYYAPSTGSYFTAITPCRLYDTRTDGGTCVPAEPAQGSTAQLGPDDAIAVQVSDVGGIPVGATAAVLNVTAVGADLNTFITVFPADVDNQPASSNLNVNNAFAIPNSVVVAIPPGTPDGSQDTPNGLIVEYNSTGDVDLITDVSGYFAPPPA